MKKIVGLTITFLCILSSNVYALTDGDWEYKLLNNQITITGYTGTETNVVVPEFIRNIPVTKIEGSGQGVLDNTKVTKFTIPNSIKEISGNLAWFEDSVETLILPEGLEIIPKEMMGHCKCLKNVIIPSSVKRIEAGAFIECTSLETINFPASLEYIGNDAFMYSGLTNVDLSNATSLDLGQASSAFASCKQLKEIKLPSTSKVIPQMFADNCESLEIIDFNNAPIEIISGKAFERCLTLESIIIPTTVKEIGACALSQTALEEVILPYGLESIGYMAFSENQSLKSMYIPNTVQSITSNAFLQCPNMIIYCGSESYTETVCKEKEWSYLTDSSVNSPINVLYNGKRISFHSYAQNPELINSRTLVPLRSIFEAMGAEVEWVGETSTVTATRNDTKITLQIGSNIVSKNNESISIDTPPMLLNSRTMVPVRVIAEAFGANVQWNGIGKTVIITE